ncbi:MAG: hypothetical protein ACI4UJ_01965 [Candidatus Cryptobacteroides sp.]
MSRVFPQGMSIAPKDNLYYAQYDMDYSVGGNGDNVIKASKYKLNLYFNHLKRGEKICDIQHSVAEQLLAIDNYDIRDEQEKCFALQKGPLGHDRLRTWFEGGKRGYVHILCRTYPCLVRAVGMAEG